MEYTPPQENPDDNQEQFKTPTSFDPETIESDGITAPESGDAGTEAYPFGFFLMNPFGDSQELQGFHYSEAAGAIEPGANPHRDLRDGLEEIIGRGVDDGSADVSLLDKYESKRENHFAAHELEHGPFLDFREQFDTRRPDDDTHTDHIQERQRAADLLEDFVSERFLGGQKPADMEGVAALMLDTEIDGWKTEVNIAAGREEAGSEAVAVISLQSNLRKWRGEMVEYVVAPGGVMRIDTPRRTITESLAFFRDMAQTSPAEAIEGERKQHIAAVEMGQVLGHNAQFIKPDEAQSLIDALRKALSGQEA